jgi:hypothetical protein
LCCCNKILLTLWAMGKAPKEGREQRAGAMPQLSRIDMIDWHNPGPAHRLFVRQCLDDAFIVLLLLALLCRAQVDVLINVSLRTTG